MTDDQRARLVRLIQDLRRSREAPQGTLDALFDLVRTIDKSSYDRGFENGATIVLRLIVTRGKVPVE